MPSAMPASIESELPSERASTFSVRVDDDCGLLAVELEMITKARLYMAHYEASASAINIPAQPLP